MSIGNVIKGAMVLTVFGGAAYLAGKAVKKAVKGQIAKVEEILANYGEVAPDDGFDEFMAKMELDRAAVDTQFGEQEAARNNVVYGHFTRAHIKPRPDDISL